MAIHVLAMLACSPDEKIKSEQIAASVNTNAVVIRRLLGQLHQADLVVSRTGAHGGTSLARRPNEISLYEIYRAVSCGEVFALHPKSPNKDCPIGRNIEAVLCNLQKEIDRGLEEILGRHSLQSFLEKIEKG